MAARARRPAILPRLGTKAQAQAVANLLGTPVVRRERITARTAPTCFQRALSLVMTKRYVHALEIRRHDFPVSFLGFFFSWLRFRPHARVASDRLWPPTFSGFIFPFFALFAFAIVVDKEGSLNYGLVAFLSPVQLTDFEQLMLSGKTMRVSLTPNRLKTMEVSPSHSESNPPPPGFRVWLPLRPVQLLWRLGPRQGQRTTPSVAIR